LVALRGQLPQRDWCSCLLEELQIFSPATIDAQQNDVEMRQAGGSGANSFYCKIQR
jgi:hypothetical protein